MKIIHLLPYDTTGGAEMAAKEMMLHKEDSLIFQVYFFCKRKSNKISCIIKSLRFLKSFKPDILVCSMWPSIFLGLISKIILPFDIKLIVFIHASSTFGFKDRFFSYLGRKFCDKLLFDSIESCRKYGGKETNKCIISMNGQSITKAKTHFENNPSFLYWGRIDKNKNLEFSIKLIKQISSRCQNTRFSIISPDKEYYTQKLLPLIEKFNIAKNIHFYHKKTIDEIQSIAKGYSFFLSSSLSEGRSLSTIEAAKIRLIPVVSPTGDIPNYLKNDFNAIFLDTNDLSKSTANCLKVLENNDFYLKLIKNNLKFSSENKQLTYKESMLNALKSEIN